MNTMTSAERDEVESRRLDPKTSLRRHNDQSTRMALVLEHVLPAETRLVLLFSATRLKSYKVAIGKYCAPVYLPTIENPFSRLPWIVMLFVFRIHPSFQPGTWTISKADKLVTLALM